MEMRAGITALRARFEHDAALLQGSVLRKGLLASLVMAIFFLVQSPTLFYFPLDRDAEVVQDYWTFHEAAKAAAHGNVAFLYDKDDFQALFDDAHGLLWLYPPTMLILLAPFGAAPYGFAKAIWVFSSIGILGGAAYFLSARNTALTAMALVSATFFSTLFTGQLSVLFSALLVAGLFFAKSRPILAGICLGLLTVKPQFGLLVPFFLVMIGAWRTVFAASVTAALLALLSFLFFGIESWNAFFASISTTHTEFVQFTDMYGRITIADVIRNFGWREAPSGVISLVSLGISALILFAVRRASNRWPSFVALTMILIAVSTPYIWVYDWIIVVFAILLFLSERPVLGKVAQLVIVGAWVSPLLPYIGGKTASVPIIWGLTAAVGAVIFAQLQKQCSAGLGGVAGEAAYKPAAPTSQAVDRALL